MWNAFLGTVLELACIALLFMYATPAIVGWSIKRLGSEGSRASTVLAREARGALFGIAFGAAILAVFNVSPEDFVLQSSRDAAALAQRAVGIDSQSLCVRRIMSTYKPTCTGFAEKASDGSRFLSSSRFSSELDEITARGFAILITTGGVISDLCEVRDRAIAQYCAVQTSR